MKLSVIGVLLFMSAVKTWSCDKIQIFFTSGINMPDGYGDLGLNKSLFKNVLFDLSQHPDILKKIEIKFLMLPAKAYPNSENPPMPYDTHKLIYTEDLITKEIIDIDLLNQLNAAEGNSSVYQNRSVVMNKINIPVAIMNSAYFNQKENNSLSSKNCRLFLMNSEQSITTRGRLSFPESLKLEGNVIIYPEYYDSSYKDFLLSGLEKNNGLFFAKVDVNPSSVGFFSDRRELNETYPSPADFFSAINDALKKGILRSHTAKMINLKQDNYVLTVIQRGPDMKGLSQLQYGFSTLLYAYQHYLNAGQTSSEKMYHIITDNIPNPSDSNPSTLHQVNQFIESLSSAVANTQIRDDVSDFLKFVSNKVHFISKEKTLPLKLMQGFYDQKNKVIYQVNTGYDTRFSVGVWGAISTLPVYHPRDYHVVVMNEFNKKLAAEIKKNDDYHSSLDPFIDNYLSNYAVYDQYAHFEKPVHFFSAMNEKMKIYFTAEKELVEKGLLPDLVRRLKGPSYNASRHAFFAILDFLKVSQGNSFTSFDNLLDQSLGLPVTHAEGLIASLQKSTQIFRFLPDSAKLLVIDHCLKQKILQSMEQ
ncbi:MAG: hypothetical protein QE271_10635 [Bacteriovoracaceae bacterium]|nr:hypothetical protein [Bacteriovoracaceae bacterium]